MVNKRGTWIDGLRWVSVEGQGKGGEGVRRWSRHLNIGTVRNRNCFFFVFCGDYTQVWQILKTGTPVKNLSNRGKIVKVKCPLQARRKTSEALTNIHTCAFDMFIFCHNMKICELVQNAQLGFPVQFAPHPTTA